MNRTEDPIIKIESKQKKEERKICLSQYEGLKMFRV